MEKLIVEEICKNLKWYERVIVRLFRKTFVRVYHKTRKTIVSSLLEQCCYTNKVAQWKHQKKSKYINLYKAKRGGINIFPPLLLIAFWNVAFWNVAFCNVVEHKDNKDIHHM